MLVSRRDFLSQAVIGAGFARFAPDAGRARADTRTEDLEILILLEGGVDPLSVLVPRGSSLYRILRPTLTIDERRLLPLNEAWGFAPELTALHRSWTAGGLTCALVDVESEPSHMGGMKRLAQECLPCMNPSMSGFRALPPSIIAGATSLTCLWPAGTRHRIRALLDERRPGQLSAMTLSHLIEECSSPKLVLALEGYDCHAQAMQGRSALLSRLDGAFDVISRALTDSGRASTASIMICSEVGRSRAENPRGGTDHGNLSIGVRTSPKATLEVTESFATGLR